MKRRIRKLIALLAIATSISSMAAPLTAEAATWKKDTTGWWYSYDNGTYAKNGWKLIDNTWYYFDKSGYMKTGWVQDGNTWYYMDNSGAMKTGWVNDGGTWYYMDASGAMKTGWVQDGNTWYYMKDYGAMATGWVKSGDVWYYMDASGAMATGWVEDGGKKYYMDEDGAMATGWFAKGTDNKLTAWTNTIKKGTVLSYQNLDFKYGNNVCYFGDDGVMATGWQDITTQYGTEKFYFDADGIMAVGTKQIDGQWYYFHKYETATEYTRVHNDKIGGWSLGAMQPLGVTTITQHHGQDGNGGYSVSSYYGWEIVNGITIGYHIDGKQPTYDDDDLEFQRLMAQNVDKLFESNYDVDRMAYTKSCSLLYYVCSTDRRTDGSIELGNTYDKIYHKNPEVEAKFEQYYREKFNIPENYTIKCEEFLDQSWGYAWESTDEDLDDMLLYIGRADVVRAYDTNGVAYRYSFDDNGNIVCEKLD